MYHNHIPDKHFTNWNLGTKAQFQAQKSNVNPGQSVIPEQTGIEDYVDFARFNSKIDERNRTPSWPCSCFPEIRQLSLFTFPNYMLDDEKLYGKANTQVYVSCRCEYRNSTIFSQHSRELLHSLRVYRSAIHDSISHNPIYFQIFVSRQKWTTFFKMNLTKLLLTHRHPNFTLRPTQCYHINV